MWLEDNPGRVRTQVFRVYYREMERRRLLLDPEVRHYSTLVQIVIGREFENGERGETGDRESATGWG